MKEKERKLFNTSLQEIHAIKYTNKEKIEKRKRTIFVLVVTPSALVNLHN